MNKSLTTMTGDNTQTKQDHETPDEFFQVIKIGFDIHNQHYALGLK